MRFVIALLALCQAQFGYAAQTARIERIEITGYGILANTASTRIGIGSGGIPHTNTHDDYIKTVTNTIPLCLGTRFGMRFRLVGEPAGALADIVAVTTFPQPGLAVPGRSEPVRTNQFAYRRPLRSQVYQFYEFDYRWEMVPGTWSLEVWSNGRRLASHDFTIVRQPRHRCNVPVS